MVRSVWKGKVAPYNMLDTNGVSDLILKDRNLFLFNDFVGLNLKVYNGRAWLDMTIDVSQVGFNLSVFVFTRMMIVAHNIKKGKKTSQKLGSKDVKKNVNKTKLKSSDKKKNKFKKK